MSRKNKRRVQMQKSQQYQGDVSITTDLQEIMQVFGEEGKEPLTESLIVELVGRGWPESDLRWAASKGAMYSRPRHSLVFPTFSMGFK